MAVLSSRVRFCSIGMVPSSGRSACLMVLTGKELHCICTEKCSAGQRFALQEFVCERWEECFHHKSPSAAPLQMAKDVTTFLAWAAEPEMDERKLVSASLAPSFSCSAH